MGSDPKADSHAEYWLQKWIAVAESIGVSKKSLLEDYYFDEFLAVLDAYNDLHRIDKDPPAEEVGAEAW